MSSVAEQLQRKSQRAVATKQVRLKLVYLDFWSTLKLSFLISVCGGIVLVVAAILIWLLLDALHVFSSLDSTLRDILGPTFSIENVASLVTVAGFAFIVALLNVVIGTALGAICSVLYNLSVRLTGGLLVGFTNQ
jgi:ABC-type sulfate transport system permease component